MTVFAHVHLKWQSVSAEKSAPKQDLGEGESERECKHGMLTAWKMASLPANADDFSMACLNSFSEMIPVYEHIARAYAEANCIALDTGDRPTCENACVECTWMVVWLRGVSESSLMHGAEPSPCRFG